MSLEVIADEAEKPYMVEGLRRTYEVVPVDTFLQAGDFVEVSISSVADRYGGSKEPAFWNYSATFNGGSHELRGARSLPDLATKLKDRLRQEGPFTGMLLHTYNLTDEQRNLVAEGSGFQRVAYQETPVAPPKPAIPKVQAFTSDGNGIYCSF